MSAISEIVRLMRKTGSDRRKVKVTRLTKATLSRPASEPADAICPSLDVRGCCSLDNAQDTFSGGSDATARFHHGTWYCGYVATRGPSAATGEDEADRFCSPVEQSQRIKRE